MLRAGLGMSNPTYTGHWLVDNLADIHQEAEATNLLTIQDPLLLRSTMEDNPHLGADYVEAEKRKYRNDPIKYRMYILGEDGLDVDGRPVFGDVFKSELHTSNALIYNPFTTLTVGLDFGWHRPAAIFMQMDKSGCINVLGELMGQEETAEEFGMRVKDYVQQVFPEIKEIEYYGDPAGAQKTDKGDPTISILARMGIRVGYRFLPIDPGLNLIRSLLGTMRRGRPRLVYNIQRCPIIIKAKIGGYHYKQGRGGMTSPKPNKDGFYEHLQDAERYALTNLCGVYSDSDDGKDKQWPKYAKGMERKTTWNSIS